MALRERQERRVVQVPHREVAEVLRERELLVQDLVEVFGRPGLRALLPEVQDRVGLAALLLHEERIDERLVGVLADCGAQRHLRRAQALEVVVERIAPIRAVAGDECPGRPLRRRLGEPAVLAGLLGRGARACAALRLEVESVRQQVEQLVCQLVADARRTRRRHVGHARGAHHQESARRERPTAAPVARLRRHRGGQRLALDVLAADVAHAALVGVHDVHVDPVRRGRTRRELVGTRDRERRHHRRVQSLEEIAHDHAARGVRILREVAAAARPDDEVRGSVGRQSGVPAPGANGHSTATGSAAAMASPAGAPPAFG